jgi:predicted acetyltransferase
MDFSLLRASKEYKPIFENLMQFYIYDFSEYIELDVEENGLFKPYHYLEEYWAEENNRFPYIIKKNNKYVGFVLVKRIESESRTYFSVAEFFIMKKYRRNGVGKAIAFEIFKLHKGQWEVYQKETNKPAQIFWSKVIGEYTKGMFEERYEDGKRIQDFES